MIRDNWRSPRRDPATRCAAPQAVAADLDPRSGAEGSHRVLEPILNNLREVDGVQGAMVIDDDAAVLAYRAHPIYNDLSVLHQVARSVLTAVESVQLVQDDWEALTAQFGEGKLLLRSLRTTAARRYILTVIADANLNVAFLGVALRVAGQKLVTEIDQLEATGRSGPIPLAFTGSTGSFATVSPEFSRGDATRGSEATRTETSRTEATRTERPGSWSGVGSGTGVRNAAPALGTPATGTSKDWDAVVRAPAPNVTSGEIGVLDPASSSFLSAATKALAASVGPMAKVFVKEAVRKVCGERPFSRADGPAVLAHLATTIDDTDDRASFQRATRAL
jgi:predicted regulator of Ras-like GTPase activity (Roadblock/LC7/MglB family)